MRIGTLVRFGVAAGAVGALGVLTACGSGASAGSPAAAAPGEQTINYTVVGPDDGQADANGVKHDTFSTTDSTAIKVGTKVTLHFVNKDDAQHSFTLPQLGINVLIPGAKDDTPATVDYTFTASKAGTYRWFCAIPCDGDNNGWAMTAGSKGPDQDSFMAGYLTVS